MTERADVCLDDVTLESCVVLAGILSEDTQLIKSLGTCPVTAEVLLNELRDWQRANKANSYVIMHNREPIGLISLSHQHGTSARVGYWIASSHWHKGYTTQAFNLLLELAKKRGFTTLFASIDPKNIASIKIWQHAGAVLTKSTDNIAAILDIGNPFHTQLNRV